MGSSHEAKVILINCSSIDLQCEYMSVADRHLHNNLMVLEWGFTMFQVYWSHMWIGIIKATQTIWCENKLMLSASIFPYHIQ